MCLGVPMKILSVNQEFGTAEAEISGFRQQIRIDLLEDVREGEYVIVHAGFAIQKISEEDAKSTLELLKDIFFDDEIPE